MVPNLREYCCCFFVDIFSRFGSTLLVGWLFGCLLFFFFFGGGDGCGFFGGFLRDIFLFGACVKNFES